MSAEYPHQWRDRWDATWQYAISHGMSLPPLTPRRVALVYALVGFAALFVSDVLFVEYYSEPLRSQLQALKGGIEVLLTAGLIFALTNQRETQLQQSLNRLEYQREELDVLHRILRHNLRNDICVIHGNADKLRKSVSSAILKSACDDILNTTEKMKAYTEEASQINRLAHRSEAQQTYEVNENLQELLDDHAELFSDIDLSTTVETAATVEVNPMFEEALKEVVGNAVEHNTADDPKVDIAVTAEPTPAHLVEISIADNGPGIPPAERKPLEQGKEEQLRHNSGLGLWFVKWTIEQSGGQIFFEDNEYGGTTVRIQIPTTPDQFVKSLLSISFGSEED